MRSRLLIFLFALVAVVLVFNRELQKHNQFSSDRCGYYLYLPAVFIYHDVARLSFYPELDKEYGHSLGLQYSLYDVNGGNKLNKYPVGVALFELPLFLVAHTYCHVAGCKADGFSMPYQLAGIFSNILWVIIGLFVLRKLLLQYHSDNAVAIALMCIAFGTNLYAYTALDIGMSHPYSFFLFACLLSLTDAWYKTYKASAAVLLGIVCGLVVIVRPVNIIAVLIPLFWGVYSMASFRERMQVFSRQYLQLLYALVCLCAVAFIQLLYWKYVTGTWLVYAYKEEGFDFLHPNIIKGLFSYRKGWLLYTPMALVGLAGFYFMKKKEWPVLIVFFLVMIYVTFSWREWWYGGGFSCRPLVESMAIMSLPLTALSEYILLSVNRVKKVCWYVVIYVVIFLNIFQTYQYSMGLIHWNGMTKERYWYIFGKVDVDREKLDSYLTKDPK